MDNNAVLFERLTSLKPIRIDGIHDTPALFSSTGVVYLVITVEVCQSRVLRKINITALLMEWQFDHTNATTIALILYHKTKKCISETWLPTVTQISGILQ